jgi:hypothetical protein
VKKAPAGVKYFPTSHVVTAFVIKLFLIADFCSIAVTKGYCLCSLQSSVHSMSLFGLLFALTQSSCLLLFFRWLVVHASGDVE